MISGGYAASGAHLNVSRIVFGNSDAAVQSSMVRASLSTNQTSPTPFDS